MKADGFSKTTDASREDPPVLHFNPSPCPSLKLDCALEMQTPPAPGVPFALPLWQRLHPTVCCVLVWPWFRMAHWFSLCSGTRQPPLCTGSLCFIPSPAFAQREGARRCRLQVPSSRLCCSLVLWEPLLHWGSGKRLWYPQASRTQLWVWSLGSTQPQGEGVENGVPGIVSAVMGSRCFSPHAHTKGDVSQVRTCRGTSRHWWQRQDLSYAFISFLHRALGSGCPGVPPCCPMPPSIASRETGTGVFVLTEFSPHPVPIGVHHHDPVLPPNGLLYFWFSPKNHGENIPGDSTGRVTAVSPPSALNGLSPNMGTQGCAIGLQPQPLCFKGSERRHHPIVGPFAPRGDGFGTRFLPHSIWGSGKDGLGCREILCAHYSFFFFFFLMLLSDFRFF